jgi:hypothetical protein
MAAPEKPVFKEVGSLPAKLERGSPQVYTGNF